MSQRIGLMGLGRIGRNIFRLLHDSDEFRINAISDTADHAALAYLLRFDTILGRFPSEVSYRASAEGAKDGTVYAAGRPVAMLSGAQPGDVPWGELGVETVIEASGRFRTREELQRHLDQGARRVILCAPPADPPDLTVVIGVNDDQLRPEHRIVSNASCTAHGAAPVIKILHEAFGIERAFLTTVHAYSNQQRLADVPAEDPRRGRAAAENIIPQASNSAQVLMELLPELAGRIDGMAMNVPVANGSVVDLVCWHERPVTKDAIREVIRTAASTERWRRVLAYEEEPIVSSDITHSAYSSTFDGPGVMVLGDRVSKTLAWFDNSWGYAHRVIDLLRRFRELDAPSSKPAEKEVA
jgi:glyceraldehyde 3-phosphate dehydrogenase